MTPTLQQLLAASALIVTCETIVGSGVLPETEEARLRELIVQACNAFEISTIAERPLEIPAFLSTERGATP